MWPICKETDNRRKSFQNGRALSLKLTHTASLSCTLKRLLPSPEITVRINKENIGAILDISEDTRVDVSSRVFWMGLVEKRELGLTECQCMLENLETV